MIILSVIGGAYRVSTCSSIRIPIITLFRRKKRTIFIMTQGKRWHVSGVGNAFLWGCTAQEDVKRRKDALVVQKTSTVTEGLQCTVVYRS